MLDTESLCVVAGDKVWCVRVDVHVLDDCGNMLDCAFMSVVCALRHFQRPQILVCGEAVKLYSLEEKNGIPLSIHYLPICMSFTFFLIPCEEKKGHKEDKNDRKVCICLDPNKKEELCMSGKLILAMNIQHEILMIYKMSLETPSFHDFYSSTNAFENGDNFVLDQEEIHKCVQLADSHVKQLSDKIHASFPTP
eukprot:Sdes_comp20264_c0_seq2m13750